MRIVLRVLGGLVALAGLAVLAVWWIVWPPAALPLPERGAVLEGVTVIEPGASRRAGMRVVIEGERIASV
jgi:hypothetical protein